MLRETKRETRPNLSKVATYALEVKFFGCSRAIYGLYRTPVPGSERHVFAASLEKAVIACGDDSRHAPFAPPVQPFRHHRRPRPGIARPDAEGSSQGPGRGQSPQAQRQAQRDASGAASADGQRIARPASVALSSDGDTVAWTLITAPESREGGSLHLTSVRNPDPAKEQLITVPGAGDCIYGDPVWSPDGKTLAFLSNCGAAAGAGSSAQRQIFLWSKASGQARQLTHLTGNLQQMAWSPDGKCLGFLFVENATRSAGALDAMKPFAGVIGEDGVEIQRVYAVDAQSGQGVFLSPANLHVYEFNWAPDARQIALIAANPPGENTWWIAKLYREPVQRLYGSMSSAKREDTFGGTPQVILDTNAVSGSLHGLQIAVPRWSPDGKQIAFIGGLMSDQGSTGGDLYVVDAAGGQPVDVTPGIDGTPSYEDWAANGTLGFVEDRRGHTLIIDWNVATKSAVPNQTLDLGQVSIAGGPIKDAVSYVHNDGGGTVAFTQQSFTKPPEVWTLGSEGPKQLTHLNDGAKPTARTESVEWTNGPYLVQGWLTFPASYDPHSPTKYPLIVTVHGGPSASVTARWGGGDWAKRGYFEFQPNPRGSFGQGEAFTAANRKDFGDGDLKDILAGMDMLEAKYPIDKNREGLTGWSYGGYMTMFGVTQTHRFRAAVAGAGLADWQSYYGENSIDQWMIPFFGSSVYDDPAVYAKSSPITYIKQVQTPTLVIVGDRDGECPAPQSFEFWHALRDLGVKTQLVIYPNEGHGFRDPEHIRDRSERTAKWFADNMPATESTSAPTTGR